MLFFLNLGSFSYWGVTLSSAYSMYRSGLHFMSAGTFCLQKYCHRFCKVSCCKCTICLYPVFSFFWIWNLCLYIQLHKISICGLMHTYSCACFKLIFIVSSFFVPLSSYASSLVMYHVTASFKNWNKLNLNLFMGKYIN